MSLIFLKDMAQSSNTDHSGCTQFHRSVWTMESSRWACPSHLHLFWYVLTYKATIANVVATSLIIYDVQKDPTKIEEPTIFTIKYLKYYFIFIRTILLLPMVLAFAAFASPSLYNLSSIMQIFLGIVSSVGFIFLMVNAALGVTFYRDNSPFSKLEFSSSVIFLD